MAKGVLALMMVLAGIGHSAVIAEHFEESPMHGRFFVFAAVLQLGLAFLLVFWYGRPVLWTVLVSSVAFVAVWGLSRTVGVPIGHEPWTPEAVGALDLACTIEEAIAAAVAAVILARRDLWVVSRAREPSGTSV